MNLEYGSELAIDIDTKHRTEEAQKKKYEAAEEDRKSRMPSTRIFAYDPVVGERTKNGYRKYYDFFHVKRLCSGDSLFTRSLLSKNISGDGNILLDIEPGIEKARLSIIASSALVDCYELKKNLIVFIPEPAKTILLNECKRFVDHDIDISKDHLKKIESWDEFKEKEYIAQILSRQIQKQTDVYKKF